MGNTMKLLRAFIEASGFDVEEVKPKPVSEWMPGVIYGIQTTYKVTKKATINLTTDATRLHDDFHYMSQIKKLVAASGIPKSVILDLIGGIYD